MTMIVEYERATRDAELARLRRVMAVFGSAARKEDRTDSDLDLIVQPP